MLRIGLGYDSHRFAPGRALVLGGVRIDHDLGLTGHSDADAVLHAVTDAILGALAAGDIGRHFPDTDPRWQNADSSAFVQYAAKLAAEGGWAIANVDVTVIAERPKLAPHRDPMRRRIAQLLSTTEDRVSVKATTNEGMGFAGRGEGLAAMAAVILQKRP